MVQQKQNLLKNKNIVVGVTGGIACYKSCELVRLLDGEGANVRVVMTKSAKEFVTPMTFQALSRNPVHDSMFDLTQEAFTGARVAPSKPAKPDLETSPSTGHRPSSMGHITLADSADLIIIAPATADFIARVAHGLCDDLLSTILCVTRAPVFFAPSMNVHMYENKIVQKNISTLKNHGYRFIDPTSGSLACGYEGMGRMEEPVKIVEAIKKK